jgi:hypothetical protein
MVGEGWHAAFAERARAWWTAERLADLRLGHRLATPDRAPHLLRALGLLDRDARLPAGNVRKYRQVNHLLGFLRPALDDLPTDGVLVDAGCGRSALGMLATWYLGQSGSRVRLVGIDRNADVIAGCGERAAMAGLGDRMAFRVADLADADPVDLAAEAFGGEPRVIGVLALHACDTATDDALVMAVRSEAGFVAVAPCCQAELARRWATLDEPGGLGPIVGNAHFRRTVAATITDAMRVELLRSVGYDLRAVEFVEAHHTPKNTLLYGHRTGQPRDRVAYDGLVERFGGVGIGLADRI